MSCIFVKILHSILLAVGPQLQKANRDIYIKNLLLENQDRSILKVLKV